MPSGKPPCALPPGTLATSQKGASWSNIRPQLSPEILHVIKNTLKFEHITPVQVSTIPNLLGTKDVAVEAPTGSGKTLAFVIPVLEKLLSLVDSLSPQDVMALIITPTRELSHQIFNVLKIFSEAFIKINQDLRVLQLIGGVFKNEDLINIRENGCNIIVGTPGRIEDTLNRVGEVKLRKLEMLILDEADVLLSMGFHNSITNIIKRCPIQRRTALFSATLTRKVQELVKAGMRNPIKISVKVEDKSTNSDLLIPSTLCNYIIRVECDMKFSLLVHLLKTVAKDKKVIVYFSTVSSIIYFKKVLLKLKIFDKIKVTGGTQDLSKSLKENSFENKKTINSNVTNDKENIKNEACSFEYTENRSSEISNDSNLLDQEIECNEKRISHSSTQQNNYIDQKNNLSESQMNHDGFQILSLHGKISQSTRLKIYNNFVKMKTGLLMCTDVAARGLDFDDVNWVIQFDLPKDSNFFVHRIGRTARIGKKGNAVLFLLPTEEAYIDLLENKKVPLREFPGYESTIVSCDPKTGTVIKDLEVYCPKLRQFSLEDRDLMEKGILAFISFVKAYKENMNNFIVRVSDLDFGKIARLFGVLKIPRMTEIKSNIPNFEQEDVDLNTIPYKDKVKERARLIRLQKEEEKKLKKSLKNSSVKLTCETDSDNNTDSDESPEEIRKNDVRNTGNRWGKKDGKRKIIDLEKSPLEKFYPKMKNKDRIEDESEDENEDYQLEEKLYKKLKKGLISQTEYDKLSGFNELEEMIKQCSGYNDLKRKSESKSSNPKRIKR